MKGTADNARKKETKTKTIKNWWENVREVGINGNSTQTTKAGTIWATKCTNIDYNPKYRLNILESVYTGINK
jgi:hypothetical protein